jgi:hypothetical protein
MVIRLVNQGSYKLIGTWGGTKILILNDKDRFAWMHAGDKIGEILVSTRKKFADHYTLARGKFRIYEVRNRDKQNTGTHLELYIGEGMWQGFLLPKGLPKGRDIRNKIIPTHQVITEASRLRFSD